ncbi:MAG: hypothetical protein WCT41_03600 [Candidatus Paceibacterota bacterium]|jgi:pimeloyl-ACP methyl ester carboxylesterase
MLKIMRTRIFVVLFVVVTFLSSAQSALASTVFSQTPRNEDLNGPVLNSPYLVMFGCFGLNYCGAYGKTVYNIGVWIKKVGNPADIRLQVVNSIFSYPPADNQNFSNSISASSASSTAYTLKWFYFPNGVVIGNNQFFLFQFTGANNTSNKTDYYRALYDPNNSYNAPQQWCKIYLGCWSSRFFWMMDDEKTDLSLPPPPPDPCAIPGSCASNVLFLPGIEASRLYRPDFSGGTDQLWEPNTDGDAEDLLLTADGKSVRNDVYTKDIVDEAYVVGPNIYKSFIAQMNGLKTAGTVNDWEAVPYDWRLSFDEILNSGRQFPDGRIYYSGDLAATSSPYLIQELRRLAKSSKTGKVTIVAHSNGGLLTKALTQKLGSEASALIDKIIFVAVPQAGTPQAVGAILHGYEQGLPKDWFSVFLKPEVARTLAMNMSSAYNLLPSANYFTYVDDPVVTFDNSDFLAGFRVRYGSAIHDGAQLKNFVTDAWRLASSSPSDLQYPSVGNAALLTQAEAVHSALDGWTPPQGVLLHEIAGWGEDTLSTIEYKEGKRSYCSNPGDARTCVARPAVTYYPKEVVEGDGTVLAPSALWMPTSSAMKYWVDLGNYNKWWINGNVPRKHAGVLEVPSLRALIQNILTNSTSTTPLEFITTSAPPAESMKRLRFLLHSPLDLSATDSQGNVVSAATSTIPGARWKRYGEVQVLSVPENTPITLSLNGYSTGSFTLDMEEIDGSNAVIASSTFSAIPSATSTKATMAFPDGTLQNASLLQLDYDGNGAVDYSLKSEIGKETVFDVTPPEAILTFDPVSQKLQVTGTDNLPSTIVSTTATSSTITDEAGNTLQIAFKKLKQEGREIKMQIQELRYNGVSVGEVPKIVLQYEWSADRAGKLKELEEKADAKGITVEGHYDSRKNATRIEEKMRGEEDEKEKESKKTLPGLVVIRLTTEKGTLNVSY